MTLAPMETDISQSTKSESKDDKVRVEAQLKVEMPDGRTLGIPCEGVIGVSGSGNDNIFIRAIGTRVKVDGHPCYFSGNLTIPNLYGHQSDKQNK